MKGILVKICFLSESVILLFMFIVLLIQLTAIVALLSAYPIRGILRHQDKSDFGDGMEYSYIQGADAVYSRNPTTITPKVASSAARDLATQDLFCEVFGAY